MLAGKNTKEMNWGLDPRIVLKVASGKKKNSDESMLTNKGGPRWQMCCFKGSLIRFVFESSGSALSQVSCFE